MSAYIMDREDLDSIVHGILQRELADLPPNDLGRMLWAENLRSVAARYPRDTDGTRPGPVGFRDGDVKTYSFTFRAENTRLSDQALRTLVARLDYQSCETDDYLSTPTGVLCRRVLDVIPPGDVW